MRELPMRRKGAGDSVVGTAGENLDKYDLVYLSAGLWYKADRDIVGEMPATGLCTGGISSGDSTFILIWGVIGNPDWTWVDGPIYASATAGGLTQTAPTASGYIQSVGVAYGATFMLFSPAWIKNVAATRTHVDHLSPGKLGRPNVNPPDIVNQDNAQLLGFTVDTDYINYEFEIPGHYAGGDLTLNFHWTNDGGVDDNGKNVTIQVGYQAYSNGDSVAGSHANSPRTVNDAYTSAAGWIYHTSGAITIPAADFAGKHGISLKIMFVTAPATALTCDPHLSSMMLSYLEYIEL